MAAPKILWIGLGNMGREKGIVKNITEKGKIDGALAIYNRSTQRAVDLSAKLPSGKTEVVKSIETGASKAHFIFMCLANDQAVTETIDAIVKTDIKGKLIVDFSTIHPDTTEALGESITSKGAEFVACPIFGAPAMADAGALVAVPAGPKAAVDKLKPYLEGVTSRALIDMSDEPYRKASTLKLLGNTFVLNLVEQLAEAHVLAEKSGLGTQYAHRFIELLMPGIYAPYSTRMLSGDYWKREEPLFHVDLARKDAGHARRIATDSGVRLANLENADAHLAQVQKHNKDGDIAGIYGAARVEGGLKYENDA
ncbi:hypothetical protein VPNG_04836 [Cytospora leucostoma]|uniref:6-phosphogluconate dehydrogenase NADP-binding domain-containing protein n=1 Tax=Cytospora leucostoma TaxID=1230097 RepID=A0A423XBB9_9PEZI|nr:hypothetical protein VPNG_04836 [Cytospora leucostoma]